MPVEGQGRTSSGIRPHPLAGKRKRGSGTSSDWCIWMARAADPAPTLPWRDRVNVDVNRFNQFNRTNIANGTWRHDAKHRGNVPYRDAKVAAQFGDAKRAAAREAYRGKAQSGRRDLANTKAARTGTDKRTQSAGKGTLASQTKQVGKGKSANKKTSLAQKKVAKPTTATAKSKQVTRHRTTAQRQQVRGYTPMRTPQRSFRGGGGGPRVGARGGGGRGGRR